MESPAATGEIAGRGPGFDLVIGNPPFLSQLSSSTTLSRSHAAAVKAITGGATSAYTDVAAIFLARGLEQLREGGRLAFLLPQSVLASRDAAAIRDLADRLGGVEHLWVSGEQTFEGALVATCAPIIRRGVPASVITTSRSLDFEAGSSARDTHASTWAPIGADARGVPRVDILCDRTIGDLAEATADFRDEYYGLDGFLIEDRACAAPETCPKLITSGMIDPAGCTWGEKPCRVLKASWLAPRVNAPAMRERGSLGSWIQRRLVPKLLVATQSTVLEVLPDEHGELLPCMPVISVMPKPEMDVWSLACALSSPVVTLIAARRYAGTAMTPDAIKLSAKQLLTLPAPVDEDAWSRGAASFRSAYASADQDERLEHLSLMGRAMGEAYGLTPGAHEPVMAWWLPRVRRALSKTKRRRLG